MVISGPQPAAGRAGAPGIKGSSGHGRTPAVVHASRERAGRPQRRQMSWGGGRDFRAGLKLKPLSRLTLSGLGSSGAGSLRKRPVICEAA